MNYKRGVRNYKNGKTMLVLEFIEGFNLSHGIAPTYREIGEAVRMSSTNSVAYHVDKLIKMGHLSKERNGFRVLRSAKSQPTTGGSPASEASAQTCREIAEDVFNFIYQNNDTPVMDPDHLKNKLAEIIRGKLRATA